MKKGTAIGLGLLMAGSLMTGMQCCKDEAASQLQEGGVVSEANEKTDSGILDKHERRNGRDSR